MCIFLKPAHPAQLSPIAHSHFPPLIKYIIITAILKKKPSLDKILIKN